MYGWSIRLFLDYPVPVKEKKRGADVGRRNESDDTFHESRQEIYTKDEEEDKADKNDVISSIDAVMIIVNMSTWNNQILPPKVLVDGRIEFIPKQLQNAKKRFTDRNVYKHKRK